MFFEKFEFFTKFTLFHCEKSVILDPDGKYLVSGLGWNFGMDLVSGPSFLKPRKTRNPEKPEFPKNLWVRAQKPRITQVWAQTRSGL